MPEKILSFDQSCVIVLLSSSARDNSGAKPVKKFKIIIIITYGVVRMITTHH